ncbi:hypothetical protein GQ54DRAFT_327786 [Martensiomyces pterosporus]|nr:hypothetical protein GQ54DRAFT_327786 [Martensiomyces pterosporus]
MAEPVFEIRFPSYTSGSNPRCGPKSTLTGVVCLQLSQAVHASCLSINLIGTEKILLAPPSILANSSWTSQTPASTCGSLLPPTQHQSSRHRSVKKVYFNQTAVLWGDAKLRANSVLVEGVHMFHFSCEFPRVNYPQSKSTHEYEIKYMLQAKILSARDSEECLQMTASHIITYMPETISPLLLPPQARSEVHVDGEVVARYRFCDNVVDVADSRWSYHLQAMGLQQAFCPGDTVDFQLRLTGQRSLRKALFVVVEQTDCFYPQIPGPHEEQLDLGRRLWSAERQLSETMELPFERDTCVIVPDLCAEHMNSRRARGGSTYYSHLHAVLPRDVSVMHETGYLRITSSWGGQVRRSQVRIPIPIASRVLPEHAIPTGRPAAITSPSIRTSRSIVPAPSSIDSPRRGPSTSSSAHTEVESTSEPTPLWNPGAYTQQQQQQQASLGPFMEVSMEEDEYEGGSDVGDDDSALRRGRSIVDLGIRLQQLIPRRTASSLLGIPNQSQKRRNLGIRSSPASRVFTPRTMLSLGKVEQHSWSVADLLANMPTHLCAVPSISGQPAASTPSAFNSPLTRAASLSMNDGPTSPPPCTPPAGSNGGSPLRGRIAGGLPRGAQGGFSTTFLIRLREFYHVEANCAGLSSFIDGRDAEPNDIIPSAVTRGPQQQRQSQESSSPWNMHPREHHPMLGSPANLHAPTSAAKRSRMSVLSLSGVVSSSERVRPKVEGIMTSYKNPSSGHVATWSALSPNRPRSTQLLASSLGNAMSRTPTASVRDSRMSGISVSSNDTAYVPNGRLSLGKDMPPPPPMPALPHHSAVVAQQPMPRLGMHDVD